MDRMTLADESGRTAVELREQLAEMTAAVQLLEQADLNEKGRRDLEVLNRGICRMLRSVNRMELAERLTNEDEIRSFPALADLGPVAQSLGRRMESVLAEVKLPCRCTVPDSLPAYVDEGLVTQMLLELIDHVAGAALADREAGSRGELSFTVSQQGDKVCFCVGGSGAAPTEELERLFEPDERDPASRGIPLALWIAELHGGVLMANTGAGHGVTLAAVLPLRLNMNRPGRLASPSVSYRAGGFDPVLVALSDLLPPGAFRAENLG